MRTAKRTTLRTAIAISAAFATGCASNTAPPRFLPIPIEAQRSAFGGWIELVLTVPRGTSAAVSGELIAVSADTVWVLDGSTARAVPTSSVQRGKLTGYDSESSDLGLAVAAGTLLTLSNGAYFVLTAPMWIIGGSIAASYQSRLPERDVRKVPWKDLAPFARFPQGLPPGIKLTDLKPKQS